MDTTAPSTSHSRPLWAKLLAGLAALLVGLVLLVVFFPWDLLRGPINRYVSERTGRHFEITRHLDVKIGRNTRILADGIVFANPQWAKDKQLVEADAAEVDILLLPLLRGRVELPLVKLVKPKLGLQVEPDGRRSWALSQDTSDEKSVPKIGALAIDHGSVHYLASERGADIHVDFGLEERGNARLPLAYKATGTWQKEPFSAQGRAGNVLHLSGGYGPFPLEIAAEAAHTTVKASGTVENLVGMQGANADFTIQGANLSELYKLLGIVLPETPRYQVSGHVARDGEVWNVSKINGKLGNSDMEGQLSFDRSQKVPLLSGKLQSKALDFDDLAPLVGLPEQARSAAALPGVPVAAGTVAARVARENRAPGRVLPTAQLDLARLKAMNADVQYAAARITNVRELPLDRMSVHVKLKDGVLLLDPTDLGVAGGRLSGRIRIDGNTNPATAQIKLDARALELARLFPTAKLNQASFGKIHGLISLQGRGNSVAHMLASSSGDVAMLMGRGQISNLLLEFAGLDGGEILKFFISGDQNAQLRCAAATFDVNKGLMTSRALLLDTSDTVIYGDGAINLGTEAMDITLHPYPKDKSILALRSPLKLAGTFAKPKAGVDKGALVSKAGVVLALGAINPLLGLAATIETGPGKDADCHAVLQEAAAPDAAARAAAAGAPAPSKPAEAGGPTSIMGAVKQALTGAGKGGVPPDELARQRLEKLERLPQERDARAAAKK